MVASVANLRLRSRGRLIRLRKHRLKISARKSGIAPANEAGVRGGAADEKATVPEVNLSSDSVVSSLASEIAAVVNSLSETARRNIALEAVKVGNYYAEDQKHVLEYIAQMYSDLLADAKWMRKYKSKMEKENGLTRLYTLQEILSKKHEADGYDVFVEADEAIAAKHFQDAKTADEVKVGYEELDPGEYGELQEGISEAVAAAAGEVDPVGADELLDLMQTCSRAGEVGAAVFCAERLETVHEDGLPYDLLTQIFDSLKPLLRPSACRSESRLTGPWSERQPGYTSAPNPRKGLGRVFDRLSQLRREREVAGGGKAAEDAKRTSDAEEILGKMCAVLLPIALEDPEASRCRRKGALVPELARVCKQNGLEVSTPVAWDVFRMLQQTGGLKCDGRAVELNSSLERDPSGHELPALSSFASSVSQLDVLARQRLERKKRRRKSREQGKASKRARKGN